MDGMPPLNDLMHESGDDRPETYGLAYDDAVAAETREAFERVKSVVLAEEWPRHAPFIAAINRLKRDRNAVVLAHNYMTPEIFHTVGDFAGDSLGLAREAAKTDATVIVQAGVHFMAETAKILAPEKTVLIPDLRAGCSLAASITGADVRMMKARYPGVPVVTYVNTTAEVKAESDVTCTSSNAKQVVEWAAAEWGSDTVILIPDEFLARNVAAQTEVNIVTWRGRCEVHERFTAEDIREIREANPGIQILAHPECPPDVLAEADFAGSTGAMADYVGRSGATHAALITECSMSDNVAVENPGVEFVKPCNLCPHMKRITLPAIYRALRDCQFEVFVEDAVAERARLAIERMLALPKPAAPAQFDPRAAARDVVVM